MESSIVWDSNSGCPAALTADALRNTARLKQPIKELEQVDCEVSMVGFLSFDDYFKSSFCPSPEKIILQGN
jgi:hypothetical protein